jgi:integrase
LTAKVVRLSELKTRSHIDEWLTWLRKSTDPNWRPSEWSQETWLFTGDADNDKTVLFRCTTKKCKSLKNTQGICAPCRRDHAASGLPIDEFLATHDPGRRAASPGRVLPRCAVRRGDNQCGAPSHCLGLCHRHYVQWKVYRTSGPLDLDDWSVTVPTPLPLSTQRCIVLGCKQDPFCRKKLCLYHEGKFKRESPGIPAVDWAALQTPFLQAEHFSLWPLNEVLRHEMLYALQERDRRGRNIDPTVIRALVRGFAYVPYLLGGDRDELGKMVTSQQQLSARAHFSEIYRLIHVGYERMQGIEPKDKEVWDLGAVDVASEFARGGRRINGGTYDFTTITQAWLRSVALEWARRTDPTGPAIRDTIKATTIASAALERRTGGGHDPTRLGFDDMDAVVNGLREARKPDGDVFSPSTRRTLAARFFQMLEFGRRTGSMDDVPGTFSRHQSHTIPRHSASEDDSAGKAIPEYVIAQLDRHLGTLGSFRPYAGWPPDHVRRMMQTVYILLRDTGRRPREICSLKTTCLEESGAPTLIWDNQKSKRRNRRLPITSDTARAVLDWLPYRAWLRTPENSAAYLFPARGRVANLPYLLPANFSNELRDWVESIPTISSDVVGDDGEPRPFDRSLIYPYAFRHSYAQRHADAGVPVDVLRELMDHRSINTTMGYYTISQSRKREAVDKLRNLVVDRQGRPEPVPSLAAYEIRSVAVPFGNCTEPSNVKAGGQACPIRFQCSGCGFYRPDPSYLPAIEEHINSLKANLETALAMDVDDFVLRNLREQVAAFDQIRSNMRATLDSMTPLERKEIEEASVILRRARAGQGVRSLPLTVIQRRRGDE